MVRVRVDGPKDLLDSERASARPQEAPGGSCGHIRSRPATRGVTDSQGFALPPNVGRNRRRISCAQCTWVRPPRAGVRCAARQNPSVRWVGPSSMGG
jgi:hypothetical protein